MSTFNDVVRKLLEMRNAIINKGGRVNVAKTNPSPDELIAGINSIDNNRPTIEASQGYVIITAERPNTVIKVFNGADQLMGTQSTNASVGGQVSFSLTASGFYTVKAYTNTEILLWTNTVSITDPGVYNVKSGLALEDYTWEEINRAAKNGYAKYMFKLWDTKKLESFMGSTTASYRTAHIIGFDHDDKVNGGKAGITFMLERTSSKYKHHSSSSANINGISWEGSLIRANCLKSGESYYTYDLTVTASSEGTYYVYDDVNEEFVSQSLPAEFVAGTKYYTKTTIGTDGAFVAGLPAEMLNYIVQVKKKTWKGYGGDVQNTTQAAENKIVITTKDWMFIPADCEVFGKDDRFNIGVNAYSQFEVEGECYEAFKEYKENVFRYAESRWFRSPCVSYSISFAYWNTNGYSNYNSANNTYYASLCFCL
jgi:hypothetical protein